MGCLGLGPDDLLTMLQVGAMFGGVAQVMHLSCLSPDQVRGLDLFAVRWRYCSAAAMNESNAWPQ